MLVWRLHFSFLERHSATRCAVSAVPLSGQRGMAEFSPPSTSSPSVDVFHSPKAAARAVMPPEAGQLPSPNASFTKRSRSKNGLLPRAKFMPTVTQKVRQAPRRTSLASSQRMGEEDQWSRWRFVFLMFTKGSVSALLPGDLCLLLDSRGCHCSGRQVRCSFEL